MKNMTWVLTVVILAAMLIIGFRYALVVNSPIVAKIDRITGDVWIANSGMWLKVQHPAKVNPAGPGAGNTLKPAEKAAQGKAK